jgi:soluble lytic murein transglycosylase
VPDGRKKVTDPDTAERLWATALLYDRARRYEKSHWIARWSVLDYKQAWPTDANRAKWEIAYPRGWWHLLEPAARAQGYPPELLISFVREESAFDPVMESFANAIGLTQMIFPTANRFGKGLGFEISRETLRDPEKNVAVGSRWLGFLWTSFQQHPGLIVAAYNAGEGAAWRWLCERGTWAYDEFGEAVPFDETRNYTKRVLSSYHAYVYLKDGTFPAVPNLIPEGAINTKKCGGARKPQTSEKPDVD